MSLKKYLEQLEGQAGHRDKLFRSKMQHRRAMKRGRNKWIRRSKLPNAPKIRRGWEY